MDARDDGESEARESQGWSWLTMLVVIAFMLLIAGGIAYRLVAPFFHANHLRPGG